MSLPDGVDDRLRALIVERALSRPGLVVAHRPDPIAEFDMQRHSLATTPYCVEPQPPPAAAEAVMTINGEPVLILRGNGQFSVGRGDRVAEPTPEVIARFRALYEGMWRAQLDFPFHAPASPMSDPGAPPIPDDLRERLVESIVQRAVGSVEFRDGFFDDPEDESAVD